MKKKAFYILGITLSFGLLSGCYAGAQTRASIVIPVETHTTVVRRHAPLAPAHGYRYRHYNHELRYDAGFGAYIVIGSPGLYFYDDHYIRYYDHRWQVTNRLQDVWRPAADNDIPHKLRKARRHERAERHERQERRHAERHDEYREERREHGRDGDYDRRYDKEPEHGYRRRHQGHELSYDSRVGAYAVEKRPGIYFYNDRYLRRHRGEWQSSNKLNGTWQPAKKRHVPKKLMKMQRPRKKSHDTYEGSKNRLQDVWNGK